MATILARKSKKKKGMRYTVQIRRKGQVRTATLPTKEDAEAWARAEETRIDNAAYLPEREAARAAQERTLGRLLDSYEVSPKMRADYAKHLKFWRRKMGETELVHLVPEEIGRWRDKLTADGMQPGTVNRYLATLSAALSYGVKELRWIAANPCKAVSRLQEPSGKIRFLSRPEDGENSELERLLGACRVSPNTELYDLVIVALFTGMRQAEILGLTKEQIRLGKDEGTITLSGDSTKNKEPRSVSLVGEALDIVANRYKTAETFLFACHRWFPKKAWAKALEQAGVKDFRFHDLRHTAGSYLAMEGASIREMMDHLGHKTPLMAIRYSHLSGDHKKKVAQKISGIFARL
jgi:integrase